MAERVVLEVVLDARGTVVGGRVVRNELRNISQESRKAEKSIGGLRQVIQLLSGVTAAFSLRSMIHQFTDAISTFAEFEQKMADLSAITGIVGDQLDDVGDAARRLAASSRFMAGEVAQAFKLVASAKPDLIEVHDGLQQVTGAILTLAAASGEEIADAARIATSAMNVFGIEAARVSEVIDILAAGSKFGAAEVKNVGESLKFVGPVAAAAGLSLHETVTAIELLSKAGIQADKAGTGLRRVLGKMEQEIRADLRPSVVGLGDAFENLAGEGFSITEVMAKFDVIGATAALSIIGLVHQFDELEKKLDPKGAGLGTAAEQQAIQMDTLSGKTKILKSAWQELQITASEGFVGDNAKDKISFVTDVITRLTFQLKNLESVWEGQRSIVEAVAADFRNYAEVVEGLEKTHAEMEFERVNKALADQATRMKMVEKEYAKLLDDEGGPKKHAELLALATERANNMFNAMQNVAKAMAELKKAGLAEAVERGSAETQKQIAVLEFELKHADEAIKKRKILAQVRAEGLKNETEIQKALFDARVRELTQLADLEEKVKTLDDAERDRQKAKKEEERQRKTAIEQEEKYLESLDKRLQREQAGLDGLTRVQEIRLELEQRGIDLTKESVQGILRRADAIDKQTAAQERNTDIVEIWAEITQRAEQDDQRFEENVRHWEELAEAVGRNRLALIELERQRAIARVRREEENRVEAARKRLADEEREASEEQIKLLIEETHFRTENIRLLEAEINRYFDAAASNQALNDQKRKDIELQRERNALLAEEQGIISQVSGFFTSSIGSRLFGDFGGALSGITSAFGGLRDALAGPASASNIIGGIFAGLEMLGGLDELFGGKIFGTSFQQVGSNIRAGIGPNGVSGTRNTIEQRERALFGGTATRTLSQTLGRDLTQAIVTGFRTARTSIVDAATLLGFESASELLSGFQTQFQIDTTGLSNDEIQRALADKIADIADLMARDVVPHIGIIVQEGERAATELEKVAQVADILAFNFELLGATLEQQISEQFIAETFEQLRHAATRAVEERLQTAFLDIKLGGEQALLGDQTAQEFFIEQSELVAAARLRYMDELSDATGGVEELERLFITYASTFLIGSETLQQSLEHAQLELQTRLSDNLGSLGATRGSFAADFQAALDQGVSPETLATWLQSADLLNQLLHVEQDLAAARGEALQVTSLTADQLALLGERLSTVNDAFSQFGAMLSEQDLLDADVIFGGDFTNLFTDFIARFTDPAADAARRLQEAETLLGDFGFNLADDVMAFQDQIREAGVQALAAGDWQRLFDLITLVGPAADIYIRHLNDEINTRDELAETMAREQEARERERQSRLEFLDQNFLTRAEQGQAAFNAAVLEIERAGFAVTDFSNLTHQEFRDLVLSLSGEQQDALLAIAPAIATLLGPVQELEQAAEDTSFDIENMIGALESASFSLQSMIHGIRASGTQAIQYQQDLNARLAAGGLDVQSEIDLILQIADLRQGALQDQISQIQQLGQAEAERINRQNQLENQQAQERFQREQAIHQERMHQIEQQLQLADSLEAMLLGLRTSQFAGLSPTASLERAQSSLGAAIASVLAGTGDGSDINSLVNQVLTLGQEVFGNTAEYQTLFNQIQAQVEGVISALRDVETPEEPLPPLIREVVHAQVATRDITAQIAAAEEQAIRDLQALDDRLQELLAEQRELESQRAASEETFWERTQDLATTRNNILADIKNLLDRQARDEVIIREDGPIGTDDRRANRRQEVIIRPETPITRYPLEGEFDHWAKTETLATEHADLARAQHAVLDTMQTQAADFFQNWGEHAAVTTQVIARIPYSMEQIGQNQKETTNAVVEQTGVLAEQLAQVVDAVGDLQGTVREQTNGDEAVLDGAVRF